MTQEKKQEVDFGKVLVSWEFPEYTQYKKTRSWQVVVSGIWLIIFIYSIIIANLLFAIFLALVVFIVFLQEKATPMDVKIKICEQGIIIGKKFYEWFEIENFRLIYRPPETKRLYIDIKDSWLHVSVEDQDPREIRKILKEFLEEDLSRPEETIIDALSRWLKI